jgi:16S rRNA (guanine(966)-N(2))-methyltransferase RsmD
MRIIAGKYKGRVLKSPAGVKTRPTSDRLRETLFNIIGPSIDSETRFVDLCAGTGAVGIEALSRGASHATFVDRSKRACELIEVNLDLLSVPEGETQVNCMTAETFAARDHESPGDFVFFDPPYDSDYGPAFLEIADPKSTLLAREGVLIVEHHAKTQIPDGVGELRRWRIVKQGESWLSFYDRQ